MISDILWKMSSFPFLQKHKKTLKLMFFYISKRLSSFWSSRPLFSPLNYKLTYFTFKMYFIEVIWLKSFTSAVKSNCSIRFLKTDSNFPFNVKRISFSWSIPMVLILSRTGLQDLHWGFVIPMTNSSTLSIGRVLKCFFSRLKK